jgi:hypothetical protein
MLPRGTRRAEAPPPSASRNMRACQTTPTRSCLGRLASVSRNALEGETTEGADVLTYRDGKLVSFDTIGDTRVADRVFAS